MKTIKNIFKGILVAAALCTAFASCERVDYPDRFRATEGLPTIYGVKYAATGIQTEKAFMEEILCIMGENLKSVNQLYFNDQKAILNTSYITDNTLLVTVPKTMAQVETDRMYFINAAKDTLEYPFQVLAPVPVVKSMSFEYAADGETVSILGNYFYEKEGGEPIAVSFTGAEANHSDIEIVSLSEIKVKVPAGAQPGKVKVTTASGVGQSDFMFRDNRGLLFDFDGTNGLYTINKGWHGADLVDGGVAGSKCLVLQGDEVSADGGDWHDGTMHFEYWAGNWQDPETYGTWDGRRLNDIVDFTDFKNMCIKFEVKIPAESAWTGCPLQIIFSSVDLVSNGNAGVLDIYGNVLAGCNNTYFNNASISLPRYLWRPWKDTGSYDTNNEWVTITVPFSAFTDFYNGTAATGTLTKESFANLELFFFGGTSSEGTPCRPVVYFDNIRAVPVK